MSASLEKNYPAWSGPEVVRFYEQERSEAGQLYASEKKLLPKALRSCRTVLDVGCAAGGFMDILSGLKTGLEYTGIDISPEMIETAARRHPKGHFRVSDGGSLPFADGSFDLVLSTGVLHHNPNYQEILKEMYRVARKGCLWDLPRLAPPETENPAPGSMAVPRETSRVPYLIVSARPLFEFLLRGLKPVPSQVAAAGYFGAPSRSADLAVQRVCFCVVHLSKGQGDSKTELQLDLPTEIVSQLKGING